MPRSPEARPLELVPGGLPTLLSGEEDAPAAARPSGLQSTEAASYATLFGGLSTLFFGLLYWVFDVPVGVVISAVVGLSYLGCAAAMRGPWHVVVRNCALLLVNAHILSLVLFVLGPEPGAQYFLIAIAAVAVPMLGDINRRMMWAWIGVPLVGAALVETGLLVTVPCPIEPTLHLPIFRTSCVVLTILGLVLILREHLIALDHARARAQQEHDRSEELLRNILPATIAERLKAGERVSDAYEEATVLFADIVSFTPLAARLPPERVVELLNEIFSGFDNHAQRLGLEKIKTVGDAYMVAGGLPTERSGHQVQMAHLALDMMAWMDVVCARHQLDISLRIGIHTGPVVAGVIGAKRFIYDLWGDTVNLASRMESQGASRRIQVSAEMANHLRDDFVLEERGRIRVRGRGDQTVFWLVDRRPRPVAASAR